MINLIVLGVAAVVVVGGVIVLISAMRDSVRRDSGLPPTDTGFFLFSPPFDKRTSDDGQSHDHGVHHHGDFGGGHSGGGDGGGGDGGGGGD